MTYLVFYLYAVYKYYSNYIFIPFVVRVVKMFGNGQYVPIYLSDYNVYKVPNIHKVIWYLFVSTTVCLWSPVDS